MRNQIVMDNIYDTMTFIKLHIENGYAVSAARTSYGPISGAKYLIVATKEETKKDDGRDIFDDGDAAKWRKFDLSGGL